MATLITIEEVKKIDEWDLLNFDKPFNYKVYMPDANLSELQKLWKVFFNQEENEDNIFNEEEEPKEETFFMANKLASFSKFN